MSGSPRPIPPVDLGMLPYLITRLGPRVRWPERISPFRFARRLLTADAILGDQNVLVI